MSDLTKTQEMDDRPLNELLTRDLVDIYVGPQSTHWILHEKLLITRSTFFRKTFHTSRRNTSSTQSSSPSSSPKSLGLPDDDPTSFTTFISWLYSTYLPPLTHESDLTPHLDLYLMSERWTIPSLRASTLSAVRTWYRTTNTYPGLRRVQYVYANTEPGSGMREFMIGAVARMIVLGEGGKDGARGTPGHWEKALRKNGMLGMDVLLKVQEWGWSGERVPDVRVEEEGGKGKGEKEEKEVEKEKENERERDGDGDETLVNGVNGHEEGEGEEVKKEEGDGQRFNLATLDEELPNGLVNGHRE